MAHIMIIEDDVQLCEMYTEFLDRKGHKTVALYSASEAFNWLISKRFKPDIVILDMKLESKSGLMVLAFIRRVPRFSHTKIVIVSGHPDVAHNAVEQWGADCFLAKPVSLADLTKAIHDTLTLYTP